MRRRENPLPADINARLPLARLTLEKDPSVVFAYLFGGFGRGKPTPLSDVDIAVYLEPSAEVPSAKLDLIGALMQALDTDEVDIVVLNEAPLALAGRIQQTAQVLVDKVPSRRFAYESLIRRQFADFAICERMMLFRRFGLDR
jgi:predicted nucleotidyltransferase